MPSVCKNSDKVNVAESEASLTPYKACISALDKKLRNLEKRKGKLDSYREKLTNGEKLDKDQKEAVAKYESVIANLEFARELQKQYQSMSDEADKLAEKASKKLAKKEKLERQQQESERLSEVLKLQALMVTVGAEDVRTNLLAGKYGGLIITEQTLTQLDEFYQLICPTSDNTELSFGAQLTLATEHLVSYVDKIEKQVVGTTYRELHELVDQLLNAGLLDSSCVKESGDTCQEPSGHADIDIGSESVTTTKSEEVVETELPTDESLGAVTQTEVSYELPEGTSVAHALQQPDASNMTWYQSSAVAKAGSLPPADSHPRSQRPLQEIVSSLQGSYNFLQDSEIDVDQSFERVNFMAQPDHSYTFVNQQMALQQSGADLSQFGATSGAGVGTQPNGGFVPAPYHQEPGYVVVGHDPAGEMQYAYAGNQSTYLNQVRSVSSTGEAVGLVQSKCTTQTVAGEPSGKRVGGGDAQDALLQSVNVLAAEMAAAGHQGFDPAGSHGTVYGGSRGGSRGGAVYAPRGGATRGGHMPTAGGHGISAGARGGKSR